jgi:hypothetical protein
LSAEEVDEDIYAMVRKYNTQGMEPNPKESDNYNNDSPNFQLTPLVSSSILSNSKTNNRSVSINHNNTASKSESSRAHIFDGVIDTISQFPEWNNSIANTPFVDVDSHINDITKTFDIDHPNKPKTLKVGKRSLVNLGTQTVPRYTNPDLVSAPINTFNRTYRKVVNLTSVDTAVMTTSSESLYSSSDESSNSD